MKRLLLVLSGMILSTVTFAQWSLRADTIKSAGLTTVPSTSTDLNVKNFMRNNSAAAASFDWKLNKLSAVLPTGWTVDGVCDNNTCYYTADLNSVQTATSIAVGDSGLLEVRFKIAPGGVVSQSAIAVVDCTTPSGNMTAVYIAQNTPTGIKSYATNDKLTVYPVPANNEVFVVATDSKMEMTEIHVINLVGALQIKQPFQKDNAINRVDISGLTKGVYMIQLKNKSGDIVMTKKLIKA